MKTTQTDTKEITNVEEVDEVAVASAYPIDVVEENTHTDVYENVFQKSAPPDENVITNKKKKKKGLWARCVS